jgi:hypothetical protein
VFGRGFLGGAFLEICFGVFGVRQWQIGGNVVVIDFIGCLAGK